MFSIIPHTGGHNRNYKPMIFNAKNRKTVQRIWAAISILAIIGMIGFSLIALFQ